MSRACRDTFVCVGPLQPGGPLKLQTTAVIERCKFVGTRGWSQGGTGSLYARCSQNVDDDDVQSIHATTYKKSRRLREDVLE